MATQLVLVQSLGVRVLLPEPKQRSFWVLKNCFVSKLPPSVEDFVLHFG
ncbi:uncharacterized protein METZ01_LOCUS16813 [marine metagenome]|uniref:Uncharacterized protein n=1 Tax=marine metagenome TaxID=408172 RepID=A0A381PCP5_9ZZZZ